MKVNRITSNNNTFLRRIFSVCGRLTAGKGRCFVLALLTTVLLILPGRIAALQSTATLKVSSNQLKATFLFNFAHFVKWPEETNASKSRSELAICILGQSPFGESLEVLRTLFAEKYRVDVRLIYFDQYSQKLNLAGSEILFVCSSEKDRFADILANLQFSPVLTVSDEEGFLDAGGMINFVMNQGKIRYRINRTAAQRAGLKLSAQFLETALSVQE